ncbi:hypothetical protein DPMN_183774 [Dreissena polymorpha]|uniref:Uncharacterized protein n=1 Tax=Dreissena polymorpha TaxID=45954 RepID=A0A9D4DH87_DREPO|nr:hypothetical protein DPMN_183774 [Dreissena polymorpha]
MFGIRRSEGCHVYRPFAVDGIIGKMFKMAGHASQSLADDGVKCLRCNAYQPHDGGVNKKQKFQPPAVGRMNLKLLQSPAEYVDDLQKLDHLQKLNDHQTWTIFRVGPPSELDHLQSWTTFRTTFRLGGHSELDHLQSWTTLKDHLRCWTTFRIWTTFRTSFRLDDLGGFCQYCDKQWTYS